MRTATDLMTDLARIQATPSLKGKIAAKWAGHKWSSDEMTAWARWAWQQGVR